jgi:hypothetical protein
MGSMQSVTAEWLEERGVLHDARVRDIRTVGSSLEITIDDEWAGVRGISKPDGEEAPGKLVFENCVAIEGNPTDANGGWISEAVVRGNELNLCSATRSRSAFAQARLGGVAPPDRRNANVCNGWKADASASGCLASLQRPKTNRIAPPMPGKPMGRLAHR